MFLFVDLIVLVIVLIMMYLVFNIDQPEEFYYEPKVIRVTRINGIEIVEKFCKEAYKNN